MVLPKLDSYIVEAHYCHMKLILNKRKLLQILFDKAIEIFFISLRMINIHTLWFVRSNLLMELSSCFIIK